MTFPKINEIKIFESEMEKSLQENYFLKLKQNQNFRIDSIIYLFQNSIYLKTKECIVIKGKILLELIDKNVYYKLSYNFKDKDINLIVGKEKNESEFNVRNFIEEFITNIKKQFIQDY